MLRRAATRVGPLALRLREGAHLKLGEGSVNDTTLAVFQDFQLCFSHFDFGFWIF